jgi:DNA gyrase subunit A
MIIAKKKDSKKTKKRSTLDLTSNIKEDIKEKDLVTLATENTERYGKETIEERALAAQDGFKPVHRRILYSMYTMGMTPKSNFKKAARVAGDVMGRFHPHADTGIVGAMVTMANSPEPIIDGEGNWGDHTDAAGAMRYIECRITKYAEQYLLDPDYLHPSVTDMVKNYDGEEMEPVLLPAKLPNILINGSEGIAMGVSSYIPSFTKDSVVKLVKIALIGKEATSKLCNKYLEFNFKYGGFYVGTAEELLSYYETGKASLKFRSTTEYEPNKHFVITALPPRIRVETMLDSYRDLPEVSKAEETTDKNGISFTIKLKKNDNPKLQDKLLSIVTSTLPFQTYLTERSLNENKEVQVKFKKTTVPEIINDWVKWRIALELKVIKYLLIKTERELERLTLLQLAAKNMDVMKSMLDQKDPIKFLISKLKFNGAKLTEDQANYLLDIRFRQLTKLNIQKLLDDIKKVKLTITELNKDLKDPNTRILKSL